MNKKLLLTLMFVLSSCSKKEGADVGIDNVLPPEGSSWLGSCNRSSGGSFYIENMYVFYKGGIVQNSALYVDEDCTEFSDVVDGFDEILDLSYSKYSKIMTESGYESIWFHSTIEDAFSDGLLKFELGFYFDGDVMHKVRKDEDVYVVDFTRQFNRQL